MEKISGLKTWPFRRAAAKILKFLIHWLGRMASTKEERRFFDFTGLSLQQNQKTKESDDYTNYTYGLYREIKAGIG